MHPWFYAIVSVDYITRQAKLVTRVKCRRCRGGKRCRSGDAVWNGSRKTGRIAKPTANMVESAQRCQQSTICLAKPSGIHTQEISLRFSNEKRRHIAILKSLWTVVIRGSHWIQPQWEKQPCQQDTKAGKLLRWHVPNMYEKRNKPIKTTSQTEIQWFKSISKTCSRWWSDNIIR